MKIPVTLVTQPRASSGLGGYLAGALRQAGADVNVVDALASKPYKLWPVLKSIRINRDEKWKKRWENLLFSSWAWRRNSKRNSKLIRAANRPGARILQVAKEYYPHAVGEPANYDVFILYTMKRSLADGITPWLPPEKDRETFLALETQLYRGAQHMFVGGGYVKPHLVEDYGVDPGRITVAGGGVHPYYLERTIAEVPDAFTFKVLFVGWDFGMKGGADLLKAFTLARRKRPELMLRIAGPDPGQWVDQDGVTWLGEIRSRDELIAMYRESDLFVMPSLRDSFGFVFLEAMTQGVPCIGTDLNAMPEIIEHGRTGYVVPLRDPEALAEAILAYYDQPGNRKTMGMAARDRVREQYTWELVAGRIMGTWGSEGSTGL